MKIAHIINPVKVKPNNPSYLHIAQPITFQTMLNAKKVAETEVQIDLYTTQYPEDREIIPEGFIITSDLEKSVQDHFTFSNKSKKLPLIKDILQKLYDNSDADYFIYTNVDIGLKPNFYIFIKNQLEKGVDALCIHRGDLPKKKPNCGILDVTKLDKIYNMYGQHTFGHDCFVFKRDIVPKLELRKIFIGYPPIGTVLRNQIKKYSKMFREIDTKHDLTFHIGFDKQWLKKGYKNEFRCINHREAKNLIYL